MATRTWQDASSDWNDTANWSGGAVPVDNDDVVINNGSRNITANLNQSSVQLNSLNITQGFKGNIGTSGTSLQIDVNGGAPTAFRVASGGGFIYWSGTSAVTLNVGSTGSGGFYVTGGTLGGSTAIVCGPTGKLYIGTGVTVSGDTITCGCGIESLSALSGGVAYLYGGNHLVCANMGTVLLGANSTLQTRVNGSTNPTITTISIHGGATHTHNSSGTITTLNVLPRGTHTNGGYKDYTVTNSSLYATGTINPNAAGTTITFTNPTTPVGQK